MNELKRLFGWPRDNPHEFNSGSTLAMCIIIVTFLVLRPYVRLNGNEMDEELLHGLSDDEKQFMEYVESMHVD